VLRLVIDLLKVLITAVIFIKASVHDLREREVSDELWKLMLAVAIPLNVVQFIFEGFDLVLAVVQFVLIFLLANFMFYVAGFGGADAKALIALSIMFPVYPKILTLPLLNKGFGIFAFSVLANSVIVAPLLALVMFVRNVLHWESGRLIYRFVGYKVDVDKIPKFHLLFEFIDENGRLVRTIRAIEPDEDTLRRLREAKKNGIIDRVWVTPALPFLVFMTAGFFVAVIFGDLIVWLIEIAFRYYR
jgi:preflagellin peptidase FlaK